MKWTLNQIQLIIQEALTQGESIIACESDRAAILLRRAIYRRRRDAETISVAVHGDLVIVRAIRAPMRIV